MLRCFCNCNDGHDDDAEIIYGHFVHKFHTVFSFFAMLESQSERKAKRKTRALFIFQAKGGVEFPRMPSRAHD